MNEDDTFRFLARPVFSDIIRMAKFNGLSIPLLDNWKLDVIDFIESHGWTEYEIKEYDLKNIRPVIDPGGNIISDLENHLRKLRNA